MRPYYFDFDAAQTRRGVGIIAFERLARGGWPPRRPRHGLATLTCQAVGTLRLWARRVRERRELAHLDLRTLRDIGVTPYDADRECSKPFWQS